jgi:hypothetical protein
MGPERRRLLLLLALIAVLGLVMYRVWPRPAGPAPAASNERGMARQATKGRGQIAAPDVNIEALEAERPKPADSNRNLFRFRPPPAPPQPQGMPPPAPMVTAPPQPAMPAVPGVPPIPLRFIGVMKLPSGQQVAILRDDRDVYHGVEGATIEGRYKILRVTEESVEMAYLDGRGRQTIRLSKS